MKITRSRVQNVMLGLGLLCLIAIHPAPAQLFQPQPDRTSHQCQQAGRTRELGQVQHRSGGFGPGLHRVTDADIDADMAAAYIIPAG